MKFTLPTNNWLSARQAPADSPIGRRNHLNPVRSVASNIAAVFIGRGSNKSGLAWQPLKTRNEVDVDEEAERLSLKVKETIDVDELAEMLSLQVRNTVDVDKVQSKYEIQECKKKLDQVKKERIALMKECKQFVKSLNQAVEAGTTFLHEAIVNNAFDGREKLFDVFKSFGTNLDGPDSEGQTPLALAIRLNKNNAAKALLAAGANPNSVDNEGRSALYIAAETGNLTLIKELLKPQYKTRISVSAQNGLNPLLIAAENNHIQVVHALLEFISHIDNELEGLIFIYAAALGLLNASKTLINAGVDVNSATEENETALYFAAVSGSAEMVDLLIKANANLDMQCGPLGNNAIHIAAMGEHNLIVEQLIQEGADTNSRNFLDESPALVEAENTARLLIRSGNVPESAFTEPDGTPAGDAKTELKRRVLAAIRENDYNPRLDLAGQLPSQIHTEEFTRAIAERRNLVTQNLVQQFGQIYVTLVSLAKDNNSQLPANMLDLLPAMTEFALNTPAGDLAALLFPEIPNETDENGANLRVKAMENHFKQHFGPVITR